MARTRWHDLPGTLPPACHSLVNELRRLKDDSGLSLDQLADATAISRSSWERYLNGKQLPPRHAIGILCRVTAASTGNASSDAHLVACWERADAAWSGREYTTVAEPPRAIPAWRRILLAASRLIDARPKTVTTLVILACAAMLGPAAVIHVTRAAPAASARPPICHLATCAGRNPRTTACEDPTTLATHTAADGTRLEIRLSPSCAAAWIRVTPAHLGFRIEITAPGATPQTADVTTQPADQVITTTMIAAAEPSAIRACYYPAAGQPGRECFEHGKSVP
jgi:transcriptional regulator with XRE-family HTH domain